MGEPRFTTASTSAIATEHFDGPRCKLFTDGQLVEIAGRVVIDRTPEQSTQIADRAVGLMGRPLDGLQLLEDLWRKIGFEPPSLHGPAGNRAETVRTVSGVHPIHLKGPGLAGLPCKLFQDSGPSILCVLRVLCGSFRLGNDFNHKELEEHKEERGPKVRGTIPPGTSGV